MSVKKFVELEYYIIYLEDVVAVQKATPTNDFKIYLRGGHEIGLWDDDDISNFMEAFNNVSTKA